MITILNKEKDPVMTLGRLQPGQRAEIIGFNSPSAENESFMRRLFEVGFLEGSLL